MAAVDGALAAPRQAARLPRAIADLIDTDEYVPDWSGADRPSELHVFGRGAHGFGMVRQGTPPDRWPDLFLAWLADLGLR